MIIIYEVNKMVEKRTKNMDVTISFRVDSKLKEKWYKFVKKNNIHQKKTITKLLEEVMSEL